MARKATQKPSEDKTQIADQAVLEHDFEATDKRNQELVQIDATYGDGLPYDQNRIINEARFYLQQSGEAMLEAGKRLLLLKEHEPHGEFTEALEKIGLPPRAAQRMMQAAAKFSGSKASALTHLGKTKLLELITEDEDDLEALADGGTLAGHTLDEIERMTTRELQAALRKERELRAKDQETSDRQIAAKNTKLDELDRRLHDLQNRAKPWPDIIASMNNEVAVHLATTMEALSRFDVMRNAIQTAETELDEGRVDVEAAIEAMAIPYWDALDLIIARVIDLSHACGEVFGYYKGVQRSRLAKEVPGLSLVSGEE